MKQRLLSAILAIATMLSTTSCSEEHQQYRELQKIKKQYISVLANGGEQSQELVAILMKQEPEQKVSDQVTVDVQQRYPADIALCESLLNTLNEDGSWSDINYADEAHSGWDLKRHADRALILAKLYASERSPKELRHRAEIALHKIFDYWFANAFKCGNWWYNEVGIPKTMGEAFVIFEEKMSNEEKQKAVEIILTHARDRADFHVGQNLVWITGNTLIEALITNDYELAKRCRDILANAVTNVNDEGIQSDWSFHQHGPMQQFGNYGLSYLMSTALYANIFNGTSLAFDQDKLDTLVDFVDEGYRWVAWRGMFDINSLTRQIYHNSQRDKMMGMALSTALLRDVSGSRSQEVYDNMFADNYALDEAQRLQGHKYFWSSDCAIERSGEWMASLRCSSSRIIATEATNKENIQGYNIATGSLFLYIDGYEFENSLPAWDWNKLPGTTAYTTSESLMPNKKQNNTSPFVGGVSDGVQGLSVMEFSKMGVNAHKAWVMNDEFILCLGDNISSDDTKRSLSTTIDQRPKKSDLMVLKGEKWSVVEGSESLKGGRFFHKNIGYISLYDDQDITLTSQRQSGSWHDVIFLYDQEERESLDMVTLEIDHGVGAKDAKYAYLMLPNSSESDTESFDTSRVKICKSDSTAQVVEIDNTTFIAAYKPFETKIFDGVEFSTEDPALFIIERSNVNGYSVTIAEPTQLLDSVNAALAGSALSIEIPEERRGESFSLK